MENPTFLVVEIEPAPTEKNELDEVCLPKLVEGRGLVAEGFTEKDRSDKPSVAELT